MQELNMQGFKETAETALRDYIQHYHLAAARYEGGYPPLHPYLLSWFERVLIEEALALYGGNRTRAASFLGISRKTLRVKLETSSHRNQS